MDFKILDNSSLDLVEKLKEASKNYAPYDYISDSVYTFYIIEGDIIIGIINYSHVLDEADLLFIFIKDEYKGKGYSKVLLNNSLEYLKEKGIKSIFLEVRSKNIIARNLYTKIGFIEISTRKNYYNDDDAIIMKYSL